MSRHKSSNFLEKTSDHSEVKAGIYDKRPTICMTLHPLKVVMALFVYVGSEMLSKTKFQSLMWMDHILLESMNNYVRQE